MSDFKILYPDERINYFINGAVDAGEDRDTLLFSSRTGLFEGTSPGTSFTLKYEFGEAVRLDYIFLGRADLLARRSSSDITVEVRGGDSVVVSPFESKSFTYNYDDLIGYKKQDIVESLAFGDAWQYYKIIFTTVDTVTFGMSKIWIGESLDLGCNPNIPAKITQEKQSGFNKLPTREIELKFSGVNNSTREKVYNKIDKNKSISGYVLWDSNNDLFTNSDTAYYVELLETSYKPYGWALHDVEFLFKDEI